MAAPVPVSKGTASKSGGASGTPGAITPAYPGTVAANDIFFLWCAASSASGSTSGDIVAPAGWRQVATLGGRSSGGAFRINASLFWKRATGSETGTISVSTTHSASGETGFYGQIYRVTGCPTTGLPFEAVSVFYTGEGNTTISYPGVALGGSGRTVLAFCAQNDDGAIGTPTGFAATIAQDVDATNRDTGLAMFDKQNTDTHDTVTGTGGDADGWVTVCVALHDVAQADFSLGRHAGSGTSNSAGTTVVVNPTEAIPVGTMLVARCVSDNAATSDGETSEHTVDSSPAHDWVKLREQCEAGAGANAGVTVSLWATKITTQLETTDTVTLTLSDTRTAKAIGLLVVDLNPDRTFALAGDEGATGASTTPSVTLGSLASALYLFLGAVGREGPTTDGATQSGAFSPGRDGTSTPAVSIGTTDAAAAGISVIQGAVLTIGTGFTYAPTISSSRDWAAIEVALEGADDEGEPPPATPRHYGLLLGVG